ncbi:MAG: DUF475 domain-containing protein [Candidatus Saccharimonadales bacterium]
MRHLVHPHHPFRIFFVSGFITLLSLVLVNHYLGMSAMLLTFVLMLVEITFSFDNAIINARVLATMSRFWQQMFMTVGMLIAVFGMRLVFPIVLVMFTTGLDASHVMDLALHHPDQYSAELHDAHPYISSFGGMFLLMLGLSFFFDPGRKVVWISVIEKPLIRMGKWWIYSGIAWSVLFLIAWLPWNHHQSETLIAGSIGIVTQIILQKISDIFTKTQEETDKPQRYPLLAGFMSFMYLQILDGSFSFDGVIGAFAVTKDVILIAIGLGIGALWVRSLTLFMVRRNTLHAYRYLEHGAHYTIAILAVVLLLGLFVDIPEAIAGVAGLIIVGSSIASSIAATRHDKRKLAHGHH